LLVGQFYEVMCVNILLEVEHFTMECRQELIPGECDKLY